MITRTKIEVHIRHSADSAAPEIVLTKYISQQDITPPLVGSWVIDTDRFEAAGVSLAQIEELGELIAEAGRYIQAHS